jgi:glycosyltransferase involved in cell wall biosynthesis
MTPSPLVTVAIPSYNAAATLSATLESVLAQTHTNLQIVVVNDGSRDATEEVLATYADRVQSIHQANGGLASARNAGIRIARGEYIALMDADDLCRPERIAAQLAYLETHPDVVLCSSDFIGFNQNGSLPAVNLHGYYSRISELPGGLASIYPQAEVMKMDDLTFKTRRGNVYDAIALGNFVHPPTIMFRRSLLEQCGNFDEGIANMCDHDWLVRASRCGAFGVIETPLLDYRISAQQMSGARNRVQVTLDNASVLEKTCRDDPSLMQRHGESLRRRLGIAFLDAADALSDSQPRAALQMLLRATTHGVVNARSFKVLVKSFLPLALLNRLRGEH